MKISNRTKASVALAILLLLTWIFLLRPINLGGPANYTVIFGRSMEPTIYHGDFVVTLKKATYQVGDIVAFRVRDSLVIHRIIGGTAAEGFTVQGDNKGYPDIWHPTEEQILGSMWFSLPGFGKYVLQVRQPFIFAGVVGIIYLAFVTPWLVSTLKGGQRKNKKYAIMQRRQERALARYMPLHIARKLNRL